MTATTHHALILASTDTVQVVHDVLNDVSGLHLQDKLVRIGTRTFYLTVSIGTASFKGDTAPDDATLTLPALVGQAIHALDRSVSKGGNQIQS